MAQTLEVTERSLRTWRAADPEAPVRAVGRPPQSQAGRDAARKLVEAELARQGYAAGELPITRALVGRVSRWHVRGLLRELKAERRARERERIEKERRHIVPLYRDVLWALDATHVGRDEAGTAIEVEVLREAASGRTIELSIGPKATARDVTRLLDLAAAERGGPPLVLVTDNAKAYVCNAVAAWCVEHEVVHLKSLPRTPQHNAFAEHGIGELKRDAELKAEPCRRPENALQRLLAALEHLDHARLRATRSWCTHAEADRFLPHWRIQVDRGRFYATACCAIKDAVLDSTSRRAERRAERNAILHTLDSNELIRWTRGTDPPKLQ